MENQVKLENWLKFDISKFPTDVHILSRKIGLPNPPSKINYRQCAANPRPTSFESRVTSLGSSQIDAWSRQEFSKREKKAAVPSITLVQITKSNISPAADVEDNRV